LQVNQKTQENLKQLFQKFMKKMTFLPEKKGLLTKHQQTSIVVTISLVTATTEKVV